MNRACQTCHRASEEEMKARVDAIQQRNYELLQRGGGAAVDLIDAIVAAKARGVADDVLASALDMQRKAQWRLDFIAAENSMGFHAPQEAARVLGEAIDYARRGQILVLGGALSQKPTPPSAVPPGSAGPASSAPAPASVAPSASVAASGGAPALKPPPPSASASARQAAPAKPDR